MEDAAKTYSCRHCREWTDKDLATIGELIDMGFDVTITGGLNADLEAQFRSV
ncbi:MAG: hypothetical protein ACLFPW_05260 [Spirochaetaceae bacterium]